MQRLYRIPTYLRVSNEPSTSLHSKGFGHTTDTETTHCGIGAIISRRMMNYHIRFYTSDDVSTYECQLHPFACDGSLPQNVALGTDMHTAHENYKDA